jgi:hypothetical protein
MSTQHEDLESLPLEQRRRRCHELSEEAFRQAVETTSEARRRELLAVGTGWRSLGAQIEETMRKLRGG